MVTLIAIIVWRIHPAIVFFVWLPFVTFDGLYLTSALVKVPNGAWFTLMLAVLLASFFSLWRYGKEKQWKCEAKALHELSDVLTCVPAEGHERQVLSARYGGGDIHEIAGMGIFFDKAGAYVPAVFEQWLRKFRAQMDVVVLMHMRALSKPYVEEEEMYAVCRTSSKNVYRLVIRHGYNDHIITPDLARVVYEQVRKAITHGGILLSASEKSYATENSNKSSKVNDGLLVARLEHLDKAYAAQSLYIVGKQQMRIDSNYNFFKKNVLSAFLWVRENTRSKIEKLNVPVEKLVEVGFVGEI